VRMPHEKMRHAHVPMLFARLRNRWAAHRSTPSIAQTATMISHVFRCPIGHIGSIAIQPLL
jgi:hypothetical protein